ncbi:hypothetical protein Fcan01_15621 [Folsomia candida]|uniref:Uncharacterized protein n=1 Tax=Folsomia candida TaxID=158441 RepID=A0A226DY78_FOLCA|nr:hypothetical protein Fcan01_15621 [Folsomia candida]
MGPFTKIFLYLIATFPNQIYTNPTIISGGRAIPVSTENPENILPQTGEEVIFRKSIAEPLFENGIFSKYCSNCGGHTPEGCSNYCYNAQYPCYQCSTCHCYCMWYSCY